MSLVISALSTEYIRGRISGTKAGAVVNPTGDTVQFAFPLVGVAPSVWTNGSWETVTDALGNVQYFARILIGPSGSPTLAVGRYDIWVKVLDSPETPVIQLGQLVVQ